MSAKIHRKETDNNCHEGAFSVPLLVKVGMIDGMVNRLIHGQQVALGTHGEHTNTSYLGKKLTK